MEEIKCSDCNIKFKKRTPNHIRCDSCWYNHYRKQRTYAYRKNKLMEKGFNSKEAGKIFGMVRKGYKQSQAEDYMKHIRDIKEESI